jgi:Uncharacterized small protein (DUF2158)
MAQAFKTGDMVQLKSGGPRMTPASMDDRGYVRTQGLVFARILPVRARIVLGTFSLPTGKRVSDARDEKGHPLPAVFTRAGGRTLGNLNCGKRPQIGGCLSETGERRPFPAHRENGFSTQRRKEPNHLQAAFTRAGDRVI